MDTNNGTDINNGQDRMYNSLSQIPLMPTKKPFGLNILSKLERSLIILNVGLIMILLPLVVTSVHKISKIQGMLLTNK